MILQMSRPCKHPKTGVLYYRARVPGDVLERAAGERVTIAVADIETTIRIAPQIKVSLRTKDAPEARLRHASVQAQMLERWKGWRDGAVTLTHQQIHALAGRAYRELIESWAAEPGSRHGWDAFMDVLIEGLSHLYPASDSITAPPYDPDQGLPRLESVVEVDELLRREGVNATQATRRKVLEAVARSQLRAAQTLARYAEGDYSPDPIVDTFPTWTGPQAVPATPSGALTLATLIEGWVKEVQPNQSTISLWTTHLEDFVAVSGKGDPARSPSKTSSPGSRSCWMAETL